MRGCDNRVVEVEGLLQSGGEKRVTKESGGEGYTFKTFACQYFFLCFVVFLLHYSSRTEGGK